MSASAYASLIIALALALANLPFLTHRFLLVFALTKRLRLHFIELLIYYGVVGVAALVVQLQLGQVTVQAWEFYAITFALFLTFSFPGFVWRYLRKP